MAIYWEGSGILVLPYAWKQAGWLFVLPFIAVAVMMSFTLFLTGTLLRLVDARANELDVPMVSRDWGMLGRMAFGRCGQLLFSGCALVDLYGGLVSGLILASNQLQLLFPSLSTAVLSVGCFGVLLVLLFVQPFRFESNLVIFCWQCTFSEPKGGSMLIILACLLITGGELVALGEVAEDQVMVNWAGLPPAAGVTIYTFMVHSEAPLVYQLMEDRSKWSQAVLCSTGLAAAFFVALAMLCYSFFGDGTAQSFPMNLGRSPSDLQLLPGELNGAMSALCLISVTLKLLVNVPLLAAPILGPLQEIFVLFSLVTACLCLFLHDDAAFVIELVGIVPQNFICIVLPCAALLKLHGDLGGLRSCILWLLIVSFAIYGLGATVAVVLENVWKKLALDALAALPEAARAGKIAKVKEGILKRLKAQAISAAPVPNAAGQVPVGNPAMASGCLRVGRRGLSGEALKLAMRPAKDGMTIRWGLLLLSGVLARKLDGDLEKEAKEDQAENDKMESWCKTAEENQTRIISESETLLQTQTMMVKEKTALGEQLALELRHFAQEIAANEATLAKAEVLRTDQRKAFAEDEKSLKDNIDAVTQALGTFNGTSLLQSRSQVMSRPWLSGEKNGRDSGDSGLLVKKIAAQQSFGQGFLRLVAPDGRLLDPTDSLQLSGLRDGDSIAAVAQQPKIASTQFAFALWCVGADRVVIWGDPEDGGDSSGVQDQLRNVQQLCGTGCAFAAILADGNVVTWGRPAYGGDSSGVQDQLRNVVQICGTHVAFAAILADGTVVTWGHPDYGGDSSGVQDQLRNVQQISGTGGAFAAMLADGTVVTWGDPKRGGDSSRVQDQLRNVQQISGTGGAFAAMLADGSVVTWGVPEDGGDSSGVQDQLRNVQQISGTDGAFAAILADGSVVTWGRPDYGGESSRIQDQLRNVVQIRGTEFAFAAILADGSVVTWGVPAYGGDSSGVQDQLRNVQQISGTDGAFAAMLADGTVVTWGDPNRGGDSSRVQDQFMYV
eukprot:s1451_g13.t1